MGTAEVIELSGISPHLVYADSIKDVTTKRAGKSTRRVTFKAVTRAGIATVSIEVPS